MSKRSTKVDSKAHLRRELDELHERLVKEFPSYTWRRRPNCITLEGKTLSYLMYCIPVAGQAVIDCRDRNGIYTSVTGYTQSVLDVPIPIFGVAHFEIEPIGQSYPVEG